MVVIHPETGVKVTGIISLAYRLHFPVRMKETCFGLLVESDRDTVRGFLNVLRERYPSGIFLKRRGYSISDTRVCGKTFAPDLTFTGLKPGYGNGPWFKRAIGQFVNLSSS
nr:DUF2102 domain-containing protein [Methanocella sp. CWC-04]